MIEALFSGNLSWQNPEWFWGLLLPLILLVLIGLLKQQQKQSYADAHLWPWVRAEQSLVASSIVKKQWMKTAITTMAKLFSPVRLLILAWLALMIALAGPRSLDVTLSENNRNGIDIMIDIDLSKSMTATDVVPNRFGFARTMAESVIAQLEVQDRVGLNVFAGQPHSVIPLSHDKKVVKNALQKVYPGLLPIQGSWIEQALVYDLNLLGQTAQAAKVLLIFTDGAPPFWKAIDMPKAIQDLEAYNARKQADNGVKVIFVGVGKKRSTTIPDSDSKTGVLHANGIKVLTRLEEAQLKRMAVQTGGIYLQADSSPDFMNKLMAEIRQAAETQSGEDLIQVWVDYSKPFVWLSLISLFLAFYVYNLVNIIVKSIAMMITAISNKLSLWIGFIGLPLMMALALTATPNYVKAESAENLKLAHKAFKEKNFSRSEALYDGSSTYAGFFGAGASAYRLGEMDSAVLYFREAAWQAGTDELRAEALYNLGNSFFQSNLLPQAIESYKQALKYQSPYPDAEHNLALAESMQQQEMQGKMQNPEEQGEGEGQGSQGRDNEGAFYGGQKPNPESPETGTGADGDADEGDRHGEQVNLPDVDKLTDYRLTPSVAKLRLNSEKDDSENRVLKAQRQRQRAEKFEHQLQQLDEDQSELLRRMFEREAGFEAVQQRAHPIPGVQPW